MLGQGAKPSSGSGGRQRGHVPPTGAVRSQLQHGATESAVKDAYRRLAKTRHPDKGGTKKAFQALVAAYETLGDRQKRAAYAREVAD